MIDVNFHGSDWKAVKAYVDKQIEACELAEEMISQPLKVKFTRMETGMKSIDNAVFGIRSADNSTTQS